MFGLRTLLLTSLMVCGTFTTVFGQASDLAARNILNNAGAPKSLALKRNILALKQAAVQRQLSVVQRCIERARQNLRDTRGNINQTSQNEITSCSMRLAAVQRELQRLGRQADRLNFQAQAQQVLLEELARQARQRARAAAARR
ncbi:hypothetical protein ACFL2Q_04425 [Thermodesulfobacteriota bacterium]